MTDVRTPIDADEVVKALAHPVRRQILAWLKAPESSFPGQKLSYEHGVCAGLIEARTALSQSTVSVHLATLARARLLEATRVGQWVFYRRNAATLDEFARYVKDHL